MRYVSWAAFYEGGSDALYFDILFPRLIRDIVAREGTDVVEVPDIPAVKLGQQGRGIAHVAAEACAFRDAFDILFIHADTGGRAQESRLDDRASAYCLALAERCAWPKGQCITVSPRHETEAWLLADGLAVTDALGYCGSPNEIGLPEQAQDAERLHDPKQTLRDAIERVAGRRRSQSVSNIFPAVAQRQRLDELRRSRSFRDFETQLRQCLTALQCLPQVN